MDITVNTEKTLNNVIGSLNITKIIIVLITIVSVIPKGYPI